MGFTFSTAWGEDDMWDGRCAMPGEFNSIKVGPRHRLSALY